MWELEERHLQEKHQQLKQQLKDQYFLQRHQLLKRHEKVRAQERMCGVYQALTLLQLLCVCMSSVGDGADAALQPEADRGDEKQTDSGKSPSA